VNLVVSGGKSVEIEWSKASELEPVVLKTAAGEDIKLTPGQTWIELVPTGQGSWSVS
jgi:hypothetical protein